MTNWTQSLWNSALDIKEFNGTEDWKEACVSKLTDAVGAGRWRDVYLGLVNRAGAFVDIADDDSDVWGINRSTCYQYCGWDNIKTVFSFEVFSAGATNYLLPWLALTAQLPYETGEYNVAANFMSFCMALGSPMLMTYSLMITILNQHWLRTHFRNLEHYGLVRGAAKNARVFLQESQQVPLRLSQEGGSLGSLIVLADNRIWWERLKESVLSTRRGVTLSLIAQIAVAILSWILTVVAAFMSALGNPTEALILASGSLWVWLIPIICGWISVGTQNDHSTIATALERDKAFIAGTAAPSDMPGINRSRTFSNATAGRTIRFDSIDPRGTDSISSLELPLPPSERGVFEEYDARGTPVLIKSEKQRGFRIAHQHNHMQPLLQPSPASSPSPGTEPFRVDEVAYRVPSCLGFSVAGDEKQEGPTFNYARVFTWWHVARRVHDAFATTDRNLRARRNLAGAERADGLRFRQQDLVGDCHSVLRYCGLATTTNTARAAERTGDGDGDEEAALEEEKEEDVVVVVSEPRELTEYPEWADLDAAFWQRIIVAVAMAFFVQWASTGSAIIISYLTEVIGLGCRSGSYVLYGLVATVAFALLFASSFLSHAAMLEHQAQQQQAQRARWQRQRCTTTNTTTTTGRVGSIGSDGSGGIMERRCPDTDDGLVVVLSPRFSPRLLSYRFWAVATRIAGRFLVVFNSAWILLISLWEVIGFYNNCWCDSVSLSRGAQGFVILFKAPQEMADQATPAWAGGVFLSIFVVAASSAIFGLFSRGNSK